MGKFTNRLKAMDEQWKTSGSGFPEIQPGEYTMQITEAGLKESQNSGKLRAVLTYTLMDGEQAGETVMDGFTLDNENPAGMRMLKGLLEKLGQEVPEGMADVEAILEAIPGQNLMVRAQVVKRGDFTNVKVQELLGNAEDESQDEAEDEAAAEAEDMADAEEAPAEEDGGSGGDEEPAPAPTHSLTPGQYVAFRTFRNGKDNIQGKITDIDGDLLTVVTADGDEWEDVPASVCKPAAAPAPKKAAPAPARKPAAAAAPVMKKKKGKK